MMVPRPRAEKLCAATAAKTDLAGLKIIGLHIKWIQEQNTTTVKHPTIAVIQSVDR